MAATSLVLAHLIETVHDDCLAQENDAKRQVSPGHRVLAMQTITKMQRLSPSNDIAMGQRFVDLLRYLLDLAVKDGPEVDASLVQDNLGFTPTTHDSTTKEDALDAENSLDKQVVKSDCIP